MLDGEARLMRTDFALAFDGLKSHVELPGLIYDGSHPLTVEAYVRPGASAANSQIVCNAEGAGFGFGLTGGRWKFDMVDAAGKLQVAASDAAADPNRLVHLAGVYDGAELRLYVDGRVQQTQPVIQGTKASPLALVIGANPKEPSFTGGAADFTEFFAGVVDEVRISNTARYVADFTPLPRLEADAATLALYHFNEGTGKIARDASPAARHGAIVGAAWSTK
jgi:hypothetical protein